MSDPSRKHVLLVEDERSLALLYNEYLKEEGVRVSHVTSGREAIEMLDQDPPDAMLLDIRLPDMMGTEVLQQITDRGLSVATIMITAHGSINTAVETMRTGAYDFLVKPFNKDRLLQTLRSALNRQELTVKVRKREVTFHAEGFQGFVGSSKPMQVAYRMIEAAAHSKATVFITGESGTGKEVAAEAVHKLSPRRNKPFVVLNCAAIPRDLMESEIFGHIKGAFTGAISDHEGAASRANGGTLFLDEICEMDMHLQSKLLRFIQTMSFNKVGSGKTEKVDIRFICATNRNPLLEIGAGRFREDLYYRLHVVPIPLPALRDRGDDIISIATQFLLEYASEEQKEFTAFSETAAERLRNYIWPGNVRQLQNVVRNTVVLNDGEFAEAEMLPPPLNTDAFSGSSLASMGITTGGTPVYSGSAYAAPQPVPASSGFALPGGVENHGHASMPPRPEYRPDGVPAPAGEADFGAAPAKPAGKAGIMPLWETERAAILDAIDSCGGNIPKAAALLGISASTIYRKKQAWEAAEKKAEAV